MTDMPRPRPLPRSGYAASSRVETRGTADGRDLGRSPEGVTSTSPTLPEQEAQTTPPPQPSGLRFTDGQLKSAYDAGIRRGYREAEEPALEHLREARTLLVGSLAAQIAAFGLGACLGVVVGWWWL